MAKWPKAAKPLKRTKGSKFDQKKAVEHIAEDVSTVQTVLTEPVKAIEPDKPVKSTGRKAAEKSTDGLIIENAILKERIALLNKEIEKLRTALASLM